MSDNGDNATPRASLKGGGPKKGGTKDGSTKDGSTKDGGPKTPTSAQKGNMTQIELTPIESLLFFNMVRFGSYEKIKWDLVAAHSNLKNAASARVRFRQILKKHNLLDQVPENPRSQSQKRKAATKSDDEDGDSSYNPSPVAPKPGVRKRPARTGGGRAKRQKVEVGSDDDQDDEEAAADSVVASASAPKAQSDTKPNMKSKTDAKTEIKTEAETCMTANAESTSCIDGTNSVSPHGFTRGQASQGFSTDGAHLMTPVLRQGALPANMGEAQMMQHQLRHPSLPPRSIGGNDSIALVQQLNPQQLAALQAPRTPQLQPHQMTPQQQRRQELMLEAQAQQFNRFENLQMLPYLSGMNMPADNFPFGHMTQMQLNDPFPAVYNGGGTFFGQAQLGHGVAYGNADDEGLPGRVDGQDEWDVESADVKREATPEAMEEGDAEGGREDGDEYKHGHEDKLKYEEI